ncbi:AAA family ATPase [Candidatus Saccharibacteria bacterium]|nr:AAA family ATPase [Candidatus Saccharibacteria bacterium]
MLKVLIGTDDGGRRYYLDLGKCSGILICGETGSGKSVLVDSIVTTLVAKNSPEELNCLFFDPKKIELFEFNEIPHLGRPIATSCDKINDSLRFLKQELRARRELIKQRRLLDITSLPHILVIIDEFTELDRKALDPILKELLSIGKHVKIHLILTTNAYLNETLDKSRLNSFDYIFSFDLASKDQATFLNMKGADVLAESGEALVKHFGELKKLRVPDLPLEKVYKRIEKL